MSIPLWLRKKLHLPREMDKALGNKYTGRYIFTEHHESHAASAFLPSPFQEAAIVTLDGVERQLDPKMLLICDAEKPVAVAGVMGGENSEVSDETTDILLESACFNDVGIRRTARRLNLATDASYRFERGVDPEVAPVAMERAVRLLTEIAGAEAVPGAVHFPEGDAPR